MSTLDMETIVGQLTTLLGTRGVVHGTEAQSYEHGARYGAGRALCVARPATLAELRSVVQWSHQHGIALLAQGANTGLVGASTPDATGQQVVLSLSRLKDCLDIDTHNRSVQVAAGYRLSELNTALEPHGLSFPVDLSADPSIGGMVATNTGGTRLIRYGDVRANTLALEVVLPDANATVLQLGRPLRKNNTGLDFKQLIIGASGAGGFVTKATLQVHPLPCQSVTALVVPTHSHDAVELLQLLERDFGDYLAAYEGMSRSAMQAALQHVPSLRNPFAQGEIPEFAILIELQSTTSERYMQLSLEAGLLAFLEEHFGGLVQDAVFGKAQDIWALRHSLSEGARALGSVVALDIATPRSHIFAFREQASALLARDYPQYVLTDFGHIADGGLHFNLVIPHGTPKPDAAALQGLREQLYDLVVHQFHGSFSAEHGIGPHNLHFYERYTAPTERALAQQWQRLLDPDLRCGLRYP